MTKEYKLICEDASGLGLSMGRESTSKLFSKKFKSVKAAKDYARSYERNWPDWATWKSNGHEEYTDTGSYIWTIR